MIETSPSSASLLSAVFRMVQASGERMAGSVPVWGAPSSAEEKLAQKLENVSFVKGIEDRYVCQCSGRGRKCNASKRRRMLWVS